MAAGAEIEALVRAHGGVLTTAEALKAGVTRHAVQWALKSKKLRPLRRGVYASTAAWEDASPLLKHSMEILAQQRVHPDLVACGPSAATILSLPTPEPPALPHLTAARLPRLKRGAPGGRGRRGGRIARRSLLEDDDIWTLKSGLRVTSPLRTVLDCARAWEQPWGLAIADAAIEKWTLTPPELARAARSRPPAPGTQRLQWVADHARAKVESPLESLARAVIVLAGFPEPTPQVWISTARGQYRVDLLDETNRVITEADGKIKYATPADVWQEKRREDALRDADFEVVRFTTPDYHCQPRWLLTYSAAIARGQHRLNR